MQLYHESSPKNFGETTTLATLSAGSVILYAHVMVTKSLSVSQFIFSFQKTKNMFKKKSEYYWQHNFSIDSKIIINNIFYIFCDNIIIVNSFGHSNCVLKIRLHDSPSVDTCCWWVHMCFLPLSIWLVFGSASIQRAGRWGSRHVFQAVPHLLHPLMNSHWSRQLLLGFYCAYTHICTY